MEYGNLIRRAWAITWHNRFLWLLGVLAGGAVGIPSLSSGGTGSGAGSRAQSGGRDQISTALADAPRAVEIWMASNLGLVITLAVIGVAAIVALLILSFVAQGGMARATTDLAEGHPSSLRRAWSSGLRLFWRYVGLWLVLVAAAIVIAAAIGAVVAGVILAFNLGMPAPGVVLAIAAEATIVIGFARFALEVMRDSAAPRWPIALGSAFFALPLLTVLLVVALTMSIVVAFAQRAIVVEDVGPLGALRSGWRLARTHAGDSLLTWLVNLGLAFVAGVALASTAIAALGVIGGVGVLMYLMSGVSTATLVYAGVGLLLLLVGVLVLAGITNAFFWTFWTFAYLRLSGRASIA